MSKSAKPSSGVPKLTLVKRPKVVPTVKRHTDVRPQLKTIAGRLARSHPVFGGAGEPQRPNRSV